MCLEPVKSVPESCSLYVLLTTLKRAKVGSQPVEFSNTVQRNLLLKMFLAGNIPFNFVESDEFRQYVAYLNCQADLPKRRELRTQLKKRYNTVQDQLLPGLGLKTRVSIALDCWGSQNQLPFLGITCHYISEDWQLCEALLGFEPFLGSHTGWNLAQIVDKVLADHSLSHHLLAVAADNASNNSTMRRALQSLLHAREIHWDSEAMTIHCLAHVLNLSAKMMLRGLYIAYATKDDEDNDATTSCSAVNEGTAIPSMPEQDVVEQLLIGDTVSKVC